MTRTFIFWILLNHQFLNFLKMLVKQALLFMVSFENISYFVVLIFFQTRQKETIVRDSDGNEEKHITYQKNGKNVKRIIRKDPSGVEHIIEETEFDAQPDSGYDFWFNKFFK